MTDLVKRATVGADALGVDEYRTGLTRVERLCAWLGPQAVCFLGLDGWRKAVDRKAGTGWQDRPIGGSPAYVMPNPSGLNAHATVAGLADHLRHGRRRSCWPAAGLASAAVQPKDINRLVAAGQPASHPMARSSRSSSPGSTRRRTRYRSQVWLAAADGSSPPEPFSNGEHGDANPDVVARRAAPRLHVARGEDKKSTLHVRPVAGGGETVTARRRLPEGIGGLTLVARRPLAGLRGSGPHRPVRERRPERRQPPRRITHFFSRLNDEGWMADRPQHVWVVPADGSAPPRDLTPGALRVRQPGVGAGQHSTLVIDGAAHDTWDLDLGHDLFTRRPRRRRSGGAHGRPRRMTSRPSWRPGRPTVASSRSSAPTIRRSDPQNLQVGVLDVGTRRTPLDRACLDRTWGPYPGAIAPIWDGDGVLALVEDRGNVHLRRVPDRRARRGRRGGLARRRTVRHRRRPNGRHARLHGHARRPRSASSSASSTGRSGS